MDTKTRKKIQTWLKAGTYDKREVLANICVQDGMAYAANPYALRVMSAGEAFGEENLPDGFYDASGNFISSFLDFEGRGRIPDYAILLPASFSSEITVNRLSLIILLERALTFGRDTENQVTLAAYNMDDYRDNEFQKDDDVLTVAAQSATNGDIVSALKAYSRDVRPAGNDARFPVNGRFLLSALKLAPPKTDKLATVTLHFNGWSTPLMITFGYNGAKILLMPMSLAVDPPTADSAQLQNAKHEVARGKKFSSRSLDIRTPISDKGVPTDTLAGWQTVYEINWKENAGTLKKFWRPGNIDNQILLDQENFLVALRGALHETKLSGVLPSIDWHNSGECITWQSGQHEITVVAERDLLLLWVPGLIGSIPQTPIFNLETILSRLALAAGYDLAGQHKRERDIGILAEKILVASDFLTDTVSFRYGRPRSTLETIEREMINLRALDGEHPALAVGQAAWDIHNPLARMVAGAHPQALTTQAAQYRLLQTRLAPALRPMVCRKIHGGNSHRKILRKQAVSSRLSGKR